MSKTREQMRERHMNKAHTRQDHRQSDRNPSNEIDGPCSLKKTSYRQKHNAYRLDP